MSLSTKAKKEITARFRELYPKAKMHESRDDYVADPLENLREIRRNPWGWTSHSQVFKG